MSQRRGRQRPTQNASARSPKTVDVPGRSSKGVAKASYGGSAPSSSGCVNTVMPAASPSSASPSSVLVRFQHWTIEMMHYLQRHAEKREVIVDELVLLLNRLQQEAP